MEEKIMDYFGVNETNKRVVTIIDSLLDFGDREFDDPTATAVDFFTVETDYTKYYLIRDIPIITKILEFIYF